jgi:DNA-binding NtrC family response regulator
MNTVPAIGPYHYLIVDDDTFTCKCFETLLKKHNALTVSTVSDGNEAIHWFNGAIETNTLPGIIICDLNMPELDGVEYMGFLAEKGFSGGIILISGTAELLNAVMNLAVAQKLNVIGIIPKPVNIEDLILILSEYKV